MNVPEQGSSSAGGIEFKVYVTNGVDQMAYSDSTAKLTSKPTTKFIEHVGKPVFSKCELDPYCIVAGDGQHINVNPDKDSV
jgi:hypothetical protein